MKDKSSEIKESTKNLKGTDLKDVGEVRIDIIGLSASGKSTMAIMIADMLRDKGFNVDVGGVYETEEEMRKYIDPNIKDIEVSLLEKNNIIKIQEIQAYYSVEFMNPKE